MTLSVLNTGSEIDQLTSNMFLDEAGAKGMQRFDVMKYRSFDKLTDKQLGFFWRPEEVQLSQDAKDFKDLQEHEKHIFSSNLKRQIVLDTVQGRSPNLVLLPIVSLPEVEAWIETWSFSELIHSRSYTYIIRNVYSNPSLIFDEISDNSNIMDCAADITKYYNELYELSSWYNMLGEGTHTINGKKMVISLRDVKKALYLAIMSVNILEGVRFYVSFACSWAFAELSKMEGNAKLIKLICRDENLHLGGTQQLLKLLCQEDPEMAQIRDECKAEAEQMFMDARNSEAAWADYLFADGSIIGLNATLLKDYVDYITAKRMSSLNLTVPAELKRGSNPLPWTQKWIAGGDVQVAPQQTQISSYVVGGVKQDVTQDTLDGLSL